MRWVVGGFVDDLICICVVFVLDGVVGVVVVFRVGVSFGEFVGFEWVG